MLRPIDTHRAPLQITASRSTSSRRSSNNRRTHLIEAKIAILLGVLPLESRALRGRLDSAEVLIDQRVRTAVSGDTDDELPALCAELEVEPNGVVLWERYELEKR